MDYKFWQTLAFVAWVQQRVEARFGSDVDANRILLELHLRVILNAATTGDMREYLRLVAGCPPEFKNRVFIDNAPVDWSPVQSRGNNQSWYWRELGR